MMPVVPPRPVPIAIRAPVRLIDRPAELGGGHYGGALRRCRQARRHADEAEAQAHQRSDEDCTHSHPPCFLERGADAAPPMLWRLASVCGAPRVARTAHSSVDRLAAKPPRTATTDAIG